jgi:hypothetical protein
VDADGDVSELASPSSLSTVMLAAEQLRRTVVFFPYFFTYGFVLRLLLERLTL